MQSASSCFPRGLDSEKFCFVAFGVHFKQSRCAKIDSGSGQLALGMTAIVDSWWWKG